jgi:undecaprenyl-phosphate 4-deoxy-4-formamido-L-arabinose transferase
VVNYHGPYPYIDGLLLRYTNLISQCTVDHGSRFAGNSNYSLKKSFSVFLKHATGFSIAPLRFATAMGFIFSILGFVLAIKYLLEYMIVGVEVEGWTTLIIVNLLIGGILLFSIGMIGEYLGRIYLTVTNRPQYSIREIFRN